MKFKNKITKVLKNKKGFSSIEIAIGAMVFLIAVCGLVDLTSVLRKLNTMSVQSSYIARTVGRQGGLKPSTPTNYDDGDYITSAQLYSNVQKSFNMSGVPDTMWQATVNGQILSPSTSLPIVTYGTEIPIKITIKYNWGLVSNFIPGRISQTKQSYRTVVSSFKYRNGNFITDYKN